MAAPSSLQGAMPWRTCGQCIRRQYLRNTPTTPRFFSTTRTLRSSAASPTNPLRAAGNTRAREADVAKYRRSMTYSAAGIAACAIAMYGVIALDLFGLDQKQAAATSTSATAEQEPSKAMKLDGPDGFTSSPSVIRIQGQDGAEQVSTGTSTIPYFPSTIKLPRGVDPAAFKPGDDEVPANTEEDEYQLLGLGIRTVSFLKIQVYVVGLYVAKADISELQQRLIRTAVHPPQDDQVVVDTPGASSATLLVSTEREQLQHLLLDGEKGDLVWNAILKPDGLRTAFRIVPTRNTDFLHLRDGWVRGITARANANKPLTPAPEGGNGGKAVNEFQTESFGAALNEFKGLFGGGQRKNVPKGQTLVLMRNADGALDALFQAEQNQPARFMGRVTDERISRLVWLNYLAGKNVSSEGARQSVVEGVMGIVERPVGTVVQKVI